jgi:hypothetical protein
MYSPANVSAQAQRHDIVDSEPGRLPVRPQHLRRRQARARKYVRDHELDELQHVERQRDASRPELLGVIADVALDGHPAVVGQDGIALLESEVLERLDGQDAVDGFVELFPAAQQYPAASVGLQLIEQLGAGGVLVSAQREADDIDVMLLDRTL